jgi:hypothetical protein
VKKGYIRISQTSVSFYIPWFQGLAAVLYGSKVGRDLRRHIKVPNHEENGIGKGIQCSKSASVFL